MGRGSHRLVDIAADVVEAVPLHLDGAAIDIIPDAGELNRLPVVELDLAALQGAVGLATVAIGIMTVVETVLA